MKTIFSVFVLFCATTAFSQNAAVLYSYAQPFEMMDHAQHASAHAMGQETTLLDTSVYSYAKGEVPLSELGSIEYETPLGDIARALRKERAQTPERKPVRTLEQ